MLKTFYLTFILGCALASEPTMETKEGAMLNDTFDGDFMSGGQIFETKMSG